MAENYWHSCQDSIAIETIAEKYQSPVPVRNATLNAIRQLLRTGCSPHPVAGHSSKAQTGNAIDTIAR